MNHLFVYAARALKALAPELRKVKLIAMEDRERQSVRAAYQDAFGERP
jgi:hypothetical protein